MPDWVAGGSGPETPDLQPETAGSQRPEGWGLPSRRRYGLACDNVSRVQVVVDRPRETDMTGSEQARTRFASRLRELSQQAKLNQAELLLHLQLGGRKDVTAARVSDWWLGKHLPHDSAVVKDLDAILATRLGRDSTCQPGELLQLYEAARSSDRRGNQAAPSPAHPATVPHPPRRLVVAAVSGLLLLGLALGLTQVVRGRHTPPAAGSPTSDGAADQQPQPLPYSYQLGTEREVQAHPIQLVTPEWVEQWFTAKTASIDLVSVRIGRNDTEAGFDDNAPIGMVRMELRSEQGTLIANEQQALNNGATEFKFPTPIPVQKGHRYALRVTNISGARLGFYVARYPGGHQADVIVKLGAKPPQPVKGWSLSGAVRGR
jgi:transcriptional regulator with XRE-family HTH domain